MRNVLTVFIASPSDLAPERQRALQVVAEINEILRSVNWSVELIGWEDTLAGYGRPQALINRDVESCDLFIGVAWRRWGTPPALDSIFSSGFEEEFTIARSRREQTSSPEIWMFFKKVDAEQVVDAGAQLQRVIAFRESLVASKTVLFKEFETVDAWEQMLRNHLLRHVFDMGGTPSKGPEGPTKPAATAPPEAVATNTPGAGDQLAMIARSLTPAFASGDLDEVAKSIADGDEVAFVAVRTMLLSVALVAASRTSASRMPTHELNTLYRYRERLRGTDDELYVLFRTLLADEPDVNPGWFWLKDLERRAVLARLWRVIFYGDDSTARARSFAILREAAVPVFPGLRESFFTEMLPSLPSDVRDDAWAYLIDVATTEDLKALGEATGTWLESRVGWLRAWVGADRQLDQFLAHIPDPQLFSDPMKPVILASIPKLTQRSLELLQAMPIMDLSKGAAAEMRKRGLTVADDVPRLAPKRRGLSIASLLSGAESRQGETDIERHDRLKLQNGEDLKRALDWLSVDGSTIYQLLAERGEISREIVRNDILSAFKRLRDLAYESVERDHGPEAATKVKHDFPNLEGFITKEFTEKALVALTAGSTPDDVGVARSLLKQDGTRSAALEIVATHGEPKDVEQLLEVALGSYGDDRITALKGVCRLTPDKLGTAKTLISAESRDLRRAGLTLLRDAQNGEALPLLQELLSHEDEEVRVTAIALLQLRLSKERIVDLLTSYLTKGSYYYNVVTWLDRVVYAPEPIRQYYLSILNSKLKEVASWMREVS